MNDIIETFIHDHLFLHLVLIAVSMTAIIIAMGDRFYFGDSEGQTAWGTSYLEEVQNDSDKSEEIF